MGATEEEQRRAERKLPADSSSDDEVNSIASSSVSCVLVLDPVLSRFRVFRRHLLL